MSNCEQRKESDYVTEFTVTVELFTLKLSPKSRLKTKTNQFLSCGKPLQFWTRFVAACRRVESLIEFQACTVAIANFENPETKIRQKIYLNDRKMGATHPGTLKPILEKAT